MLVFPTVLAAPVKASSANIYMYISVGRGRREGWVAQWWREAGRGWGWSRRVAVQR